MRDHAAVTAWHFKPRFCVLGLPLAPRRPLIPFVYVLLDRLRIYRTRHDVDIGTLFGLLRPVVIVIRWYGNTPTERNR